MADAESLSYLERLALSEALLKLPEGQFKQLVFALKPPTGILPSDQSALGDRVSSLLQWAEQSGPGLKKVRELLDQRISQSETIPAQIGGQTVMGGQATQVNQPIGPSFTGPMTGNTINIYGPGPGSGGDQVFPESKDYLLLIRKLQELETIKKVCNPYLEEPLDITVNSLMRDFIREHVNNITLDDP